VKGQNNQDPVQICVECLQNGTNKSLAFEQAQIAEDSWWAIDVTDQNLTQKQLKKLLDVRAMVLGTIASVYAWNEVYDNAKKLEDEFLLVKTLWEGNYRQVVDNYLVVLMIQKQFSHLEAVFSKDSEFKNSFLAHYEVY